MVRGLCPRDWIRWVADARRTHRGDAGAVGHAERMRLTHPGNHPAQGASRTPPPTAGCETKAAAYDAAGAVSSRLTNGARAVPAILHTLDGGSYRAHRGKHGCNRSRWPSAPTLPRQSRNRGAPRTVRPTSWQQNERCGMERNGCRQSQTINSRPPHGSAETYPQATAVGGGVLDAPSAG